jgi:hypothetical protein
MAPEPEVEVSATAVGVMEPSLREHVAVVVETSDFHDRLFIEVAWWISAEP